MLHDVTDLGAYGQASIDLYSEVADKKWWNDLVTADEQGCWPTDATGRVKSDQLCLVVIELEVIGAHPAGSLVDAGCKTTE